MENKESHRVQTVSRGTQTSVTSTVWEEVKLALKEVAESLKSVEGAVALIAELESEGWPNADRAEKPANNLEGAGSTNRGEPEKPRVTSSPEEADKSDELKPEASAAGDGPEDELVVDVVDHRFDAGNSATASADAEDSSYSPIDLLAVDEGWPTGDMAWPPGDRIV